MLQRLLFCAASAHSINCGIDCTDFDSNELVVGHFPWH
jgi:hypothetical protein